LNTTISIIFQSLNLGFRFPFENLNKTDWPSTIEVKCGWGKAWDPPTVPGCKDWRGCPLPPSRTAEIWNSFDDDESKSLEVNSMYWYQCRSGLFQVNQNYLIS
jgi:hypothetical protein